MIEGPIRIEISKIFSETPGGRYISDGPFSGELFRDTVLVHAVDQALYAGVKLEINFDGCYGFSTGFLEEAFGGFVRKYKVFNLFDMLIIISTEDENLPNQIKEYIHDAELLLP